MKDLGIVICNFNKVDYLKGCLETLFKSNFENLSYDVIVVDNASTDGSSEFVKKNYPSVILLQNEENTGGSGGFDRGIRYCIDKKYEYVALLDNDILLEENTIINLINYIKENPKVGVVGSKICTMDNPEIVQEMGSFIDFENKFNFEVPLKSYKDDNTLPEVVVCDYVPACCLVTTKEILEKVGSFNTDHFIYWDDMDWCKRVTNLGFEIHAINNSRVFHKMGAANHINTFVLYYFERNRILFFLKYISEDKFNKFTESLSNWLISLTFFSNLKGNYATPKSFLCAIDDLLLGNLGKQDSGIFIKEKEINILDKYSLDNRANICIYFSNHMISNRRVYLYVKNLFSNIQIYCDSENRELIESNFEETIISDELFEKSKFDNIFFILEHILDYKEEEKFDYRYIFIDQFINTSIFKDIDSIKKSFAIFKDISKNIYEPILKRKFQFIREKYRDEK
ncbi:glycosyltransferase family 2 protein [Halarcobacter ebronensis]|nr:glycosyltransferase family 2 protein [Halarcobacter ebronensis]